MSSCCCCCCCCGIRGRRRTIAGSKAAAVAVAEGTGGWKGSSDAAAAVEGGVGVGYDNVRMTPRTGSTDPGSCCLPFDVAAVAIGLRISWTLLEECGEDSSGVGLEVPCPLLKMLLDKEARRRKKTWKGKGSMPAEKGTGSSLTGIPVLVGRRKEEAAEDPLTGTRHLPAAPEETAAVPASE